MFKAGNLTPCQATGERDANRIPLELALCIAAMSGLLDGQYCSQKTGTKPVQVQGDLGLHGHKRLTHGGRKAVQIKGEIGGRRHGDLYRTPA